MAPLTTVTRSGGRRSKLALPEPLRPLADVRLVNPRLVREYVSAPEGMSRWKLLEAHFSSHDHPLVKVGTPTRHIPGAIQVHPSYLEAGADRSKYYPDYDHPADGNLLADSDLWIAIERLGITPDTLVIVYGREPDGAMAAARLVWALMYAGVSKIWLLDGGIEAWLSAGEPSSPKIKHARELWNSGESREGSLEYWRARPEILATTEEVEEIAYSSPSAQGKLVDVRRPGEWDGTLAYCYSFFSQTGHIPTATCQGNWTNLVDGQTRRLGPMLDAISQRWRKLGIIDAGVDDGDTMLIFYCGTGWRSSIAFLIACLLGLRAKNYDSGFYGWSWNVNNEIVRIKRGECCSRRAGDVTTFSPARSLFEMKSI